MKQTIIKNKAGVSPVIGVILMVAITTAIACAVYIYVSGMIDITPHDNIIKSKIDINKSYEIDHITYSYIWRDHNIHRVKITLVDYINSSIITIDGFIFNTLTHQFGYDNNSELIKLKELE